MSQDNLCCVCWEVIITGVATPCHHPLCTVCFGLLKGSPISCPLCRGAIVGNPVRSSAATSSSPLDIKECPACWTPIEKVGGCRWMNCLICEYEFCWCCLNGEGRCRYYISSFEEQDTWKDLYNEKASFFKRCWFPRRRRSTTLRFLTGVFFIWVGVHVGKKYL